MSLHERIKEARNNRGLTQTQLGELIGVAKTTIAGYEKEREPTAAQLGAIADALGVDVTFILQDEIKIRKESYATPWEMENIIKKYRALDQYGQNAVGSILDIEFVRCTEQEQKSTRTIDLIPFLRSLQPVSAGTGAYLGPEEFETIFVENNDLTRRASFGVTVRGDSMEPLYHDGDVLVVEGADDIAIGEIGVFTLDGDGYVKKRGEGVLISLNPDYAPIPLTEDSWCNGRVIGVLDPAWISEK